MGHNVIYVRLSEWCFYQKSNYIVRNSILGILNRFAYRILKTQSSFFVVQFPKNGDLVDNIGNMVMMYNLPNCLQVQYTKKYVFVM